MIPGIRWYVMFMVVGTTDPAYHPKLPDEIHATKDFLVGAPQYASAWNEQQCMGIAKAIDGQSVPSLKGKILAWCVKESYVSEMSRP